ncbi:MULTISPECIES: hypothetical protein [unclassified Aeromonas]|uniref:hypothetical protein n=1 Tax=unclassified Aeromonas TaxID=257493 RepID=UPI00352950A3
MLLPVAKIGSKNINILENYKQIACKNNWLNKGDHSVAFLFLSLFNQEISPCRWLGAIPFGRRFAGWFALTSTLACTLRNGLAVTSPFLKLRPHRFAIAFTTFIHSWSIATGVTVSTFVVKKVGVPVFLFLIDYLRCKISWTRLFNPLNIPRISFIALL